MTELPNGYKYECSALDCKARRFIGTDDAAKTVGPQKCLKCKSPMTKVVKPFPRR